LTKIIRPAIFSRMEILGWQIRAARAALNWSAADLAAASGVSAATVQRIEAGATTINSVKTAIVLALERAEIEFVPSGIKLGRPNEAAA
jgi:transcriptional regulator with XRE-family HTH domain